jgi:hypothetical protein
MMVKMDLLFRSDAGYDQLVERLQSNPKFVFEVTGQDRRDKRTRKAKTTGWVKLEHKRMTGVVELRKHDGVLDCTVNDTAEGRLFGAWLSWLGRNATDLLWGCDCRFVQAQRRGDRGGPRSSGDRDH